MSYITQWRRAQLAEARAKAAEARVAELLAMEKRAREELAREREYGTGLNMERYAVVRYILGVTEGEGA